MFKIDSPLYNDVWTKLIIYRIKRDGSLQRVSTRLLPTYQARLIPGVNYL